MTRPPTQLNPRPEERAVHVDHPRFLEDAGSRRGVLIALRQLARQPGQWAHLRVEHGADCCQRESWEETLWRLLELVAADGYVIEYLGPRRPMVAVREAA